MEFSRLFSRLPDYVGPTLADLQERVVALTRERRRDGFEHFRLFKQDCEPSVTIRMPEEFARIQRDWKQAQRDVPSKQRSVYRQWDVAIEHHYDLVSRLMQLTLE